MRTRTTSRNRTNRLLQRGGTIAGAATALVLAGSGLALGATTRDVGPVVGGPVQPVVQHVLPQPRPQVAPTVPTLSGTLKTVTSTVRSLTTPPTATAPKPPQNPPAKPPANQKPVFKQSGQHPAVAAQYARPSHRVASALHAGAALRSEDLQAAAPRAADFQRTDPAIAPRVTPQLQPSARGPLAGLPAGARHVIPLALLVSAAAILAALGSGHIGLWRARRAA
ncbi:MAG: hypothetical protein ACJ735_16160 [Actinomycetes bacterium]